MVNFLEIHPWDAATEGRRCYFLRQENQTLRQFREVLTETRKLPLFAPDSHTQSMTDEESIRAALAANPFPPNPWIQVTGEGIIIKAGYSETIQRMLRWVPKVQWIPERRHWKVPLAGAELVRSVLPELSRLAEATHEEFRSPESAAQAEATPTSAATRPVLNPNDSERDLFRKAARFLFGTDWQRDTARALGRDEATLACWLVGDRVEEDKPLVLLEEMLALMHRRAAAIKDAAEQLAAAIENKKPVG